MKKMILLALVAVGIVTGITGCASNKGKLYGADQAREAGMPGWAQPNTSFLTKEAADFDARVLSQDGLYTSGMAEDLGNMNITASAAELHARNNMAAYINSQAARLLKEKQSTSGGYKIDLTDKQILGVNVSLVGGRVIDSYRTKSGNMYVLLFCSFENIKKSYSDTEIAEIVSDFTKEGSE